MTEQYSIASAWTRASVLFKTIQLSTKPGEVQFVEESKARRFEQLLGIFASHAAIGTSCKSFEHGSRFFAPFES